MPTTKVKIFVSYSHQDIHHLEELLGFLQGLKNEGVKFLTDRRIATGELVLWYNSQVIIH